MRELEVAKRAAEAAGQILLQYFDSGVDVRHKNSSGSEGDRQSYNLVSDADVEAEQAIVEVIREAFPDHSLLAEESHHSQAATNDLWIIDPLDGTNNFVHGIPHSAVSIAYYRESAPVCGVVYNPMRKDWYVAIQGQGAFHNGRQVHVTDNTQLSEVLVATGFYYDRGAMMEATLAAIGELFRQNIHGIRRFGTASLDLAAVGCGQFGAFFEYELSAWDFAAGRLFVEEAGGKVTTCGGEPLPISNSSVLASNGHIHQDILDIVVRYKSK